MKMAMATLGDHMIIVQEIGAGFYCVSLCENENRDIDNTIETVKSNYVSVQVYTEKISSLMDDIKNNYEWYHKKAKYLNQEASYE